MNVVESNSIADTTYILYSCQETQMLSFLPLLKQSIDLENGAKNSSIQTFMNKSQIHIYTKFVIIALIEDT